MFSFANVDYRMIAERVKVCLREEVGLVKGKDLESVEGGVFGF